MSFTFKSAALALSLAAAGLAASLGAAAAATVSFGALPATATANPLATTTSGVVFENITGSVPNVNRSPWLSAGSSVDPDAVTSFYTSVSGGAKALYEFGSARTVISFVWGSPDTHNLLKFFLGGVEVDTFALNSGDIIVPASFGANSALATITDIAGGSFDAVEFSAGNNAFEYGNVAAVPLPAAGLLMMGALAGLGVLRQRKAAARA